jgi:hypothetical protein
MIEGREPQVPYRGLAFFTGKDESMFAGREEEIEEVATRILAGDTLVLYGPSGVGKTSLLRAGVVPALEKERGYGATYVRPLRSPRGDVWEALGANPDEPLAHAITRLPKRAMPAAAGPVAVEPDARASAVEPSVRVSAVEPSAVASAVVGASIPPTSQVGVARRGGDGANGANGEPHGAIARAPHVLLLDQVEELFTRFDEQQCRPLWDGLVELLDSPMPVRLVLSLREDYLHLLDSAHPRLSNLLDRRFRLRGLTPIGARTAMVRPLIARGIRYAPELIDRCVTELTEVPPGHPEEHGVVDPTLLQTMCSEMYRRAEQRSGDRPSLELADYEASGGLDGVFRRHLTELFKLVDAEDHLLLSLVLQEMTTAHATKKPATVTRLLASGLLAERADIESLLDKLVAARLVRKYSADPEPWYELIHDRLVQVLPEQFARDPRFLQIGFMRDLVRQLSKGFSKRVAGAPLLSQQQLADVVEPFRTYIRFNADELSLLFRSAVAAEHNVAAWRDAFEAVVPGGAVAVLLEMIGPDRMLRRDSTRRGAAAAVGVLGVDDRPVREALMQLALRDPEPEVEKAAATALKEVAGKEEIIPLAAALRDRSLRDRALRVLGAIDARPALRSGIHARDRAIARRRHRQAQLHAAREDIRFGGDDGRWKGLRMGSLAGLVAALFWCILVVWLGASAAEGYAWGIPCIVLASAILGSVCGRATSRLLAKCSALDRRPSRARAAADIGALSAFAVFGLPLFWGLSAACSTLVGRRFMPDSLVYVTAAAALPALLITIVTVHFSKGVLTRLGRLFLLSRSRRVGAWILATCCSLPWLIVIALGYAMTLDAFTAWLLPGLVVIAFVAATWSSVCAASIVAALATSVAGSTRPLRSASPVEPRLRGLAPVVAVLAALAVMLYRDPLPLWAPIVDVTRSPDDVGREQAIAISTSWTDGRWVRFRNSSTEPRGVALTESAGAQFLLVWPGTHSRWIQVGFGGAEVRRRYRSIDLRFEVPEPDTYAVVDLEGTGEPDAVRVWEVPAKLGTLPDDVTARWIGCRLQLESGRTVCMFHGVEKPCRANDTLYIFASTMPAAQSTRGWPPVESCERSPEATDAAIAARVVLLFEAKRTAKAGDAQPGTTP